MSKTKSEEFLSEKEAANLKRREADMHHLERWQASKDPAHLTPLLKSYEPVINNAMRMYRAPEVPESAMKAEMTQIAVKAFETYDPSRGAQLNTHVINSMRKAMRYNGKYQNVGYIPPEQTKWIGPIQRTRADLTDELGRDPTHSEIASRVGEGLRPHIVSRVINNLRADIPTSSFDEDPFERDLARDQEVLSLLPMALNPRDKKVFDHLYGEHRSSAPKIGDRVNMGELARRLGMSASQVSRSHTAIREAYKRYK